MLNTLKTLCALPGVSGCEGAVRAYIEERARPFADEMRTDAMGNLIVFKKGKKALGKTLMLTAHMDEVGVMVTYVNEDGYLKFSFVGGIDRRTVLGKRVFVGENKVPGAVAIKAIHLCSPEERKTTPKLDDLYIDIGASNGEKARALVSPGDIGYFDSEPRVFGSGFLKARAIDDRAGCAVMVKLLERELPADTYFVFTVQEEVGCRGAFGASFALRPDISLVLEGTTAADLPEVSESKQICTAGGGVVIPFMDRGAIYDRALVKKLTETARRNEIPWQTKRCVAGGTDASAIQRSGTGVRVAAMAVPVRNIHTPAGVAHIGDLEKMLELSGLFLEELGDTLQ